MAKIAKKDKTCETCIFAKLGKKAFMYGFCDCKDSQMYNGQIVMTRYACDYHKS